MPHEYDEIYNSGVAQGDARLSSAETGRMLSVTPTENRGVKFAGYYVLRKSRIIAVLAECGFLTNPVEARLALSANFRERIAEQIGNAIIAYKRSLD